MENSQVTDAPLEKWAIERLIPYERNNKKHGAEHMEKLIASIREHGIADPILVEEDGTIISGHGRRLAAIELGIAEVNVRVAYGLPKDEARKLRIATNKVTSTEYDVDAMSLELKDLSIEIGDLGSVGINLKEFEVMVEDVGELDYNSITESISAAVAVHEETVRDAADKAEDAETPLAKVFGIKRVSAPDARTLTRFLGQIEEDTGLKGMDALRAHAEGVLAA